MTPFFATPMAGPISAQCLSPPDLWSLDQLCRATGALLRSAPVRFLRVRINRSDHPFALNTDPHLPSKLLNLILRDQCSNDVAPVDELLPARRVADALRTRNCPPDRVFDRFLPYELRVVSGQYWTPLVVAVRVAEWLDELDIRTVVDVGSGAGKFCVAAASAGSAHFTGVEQRARLVSAARDLARTFEVDARVTFVHATLGEAPMPEADAYYLYNPFGENLFGLGEHLDEDVELSIARYRRDVLAVEDMLRSAATGTYLVTYNGFGGRVPATYLEVCVDREMPNVLRAWKKTSDSSTDAEHPPIRSRFDPDRLI